METCLENHEEHVQQSFFLSAVENLEQVPSRGTREGNQVACYGYKASLITPLENDLTLMCNGQGEPTWTPGALGDHLLEPKALKQSRRLQRWWLCRKPWRAFSCNH